MHSSLGYIKEILLREDCIYYQIRGKTLIRYSLLQEFLNH